MTLLLEQKTSNENDDEMGFVPSMLRTKDYYDHLLFENREKRQKSIELNKEIFTITETINAEVSKKERLCFNVSEAAASDSFEGYQTTLEIWHQYRSSIEQAIERLILKIRLSDLKKIGWRPSILFKEEHDFLMMSLI